MGHCSFRLSFVFVLTTTFYKHPLTLTEQLEVVWLACSTTRWAGVGPRDRKSLPDCSPEAWEPVAEPEAVTHRANTGMDASPGEER